MSRSQWQVSVLEHIRHIGPFTCAVFDQRTLEQAQARNYTSMGADRAEMFQELDELVDEGILCRARAATGVVYHRVDQCPLPYPAT